MKQRKYHYEWFVYTDNLNYGRMLLVHYRKKSQARVHANNLSFHYGVLSIERHRVYEQ